ncbi:zinc carboxypeptidase [Gillisia sp. M10.2A]|uniref:Zinc carboxypeptidase n=1 Tax=Gillisia lutea TaxID=2909668 RepID=A0ABS9EE20_9FLAO|nr:M14 family metallopeptidase [Gillisia lutea]MCF4101023.1 zinc carboxypeptidase [Gillisia lutea]
MKKITFLFIVFFLLIETTFSQNIQSPSDFLGYELGTRFTRHANVVRYFEYVAENSPLVNYQSYGETNENRPLTYAIVSSEENMQNLEDIRKDHLKTAGLLENSTNSTLQKAIVWLSYNVHGNEASSTEAAMQTLYELVTANKNYLENTVIIMDPCVNPDGRDRYVNWYNQVKSSPYNTAQIASEHNEPWPGGRPNHYLFDLNRDWAWATQVETRQRLKVYNTWMPQIHVDFHEQGINDPYYFAPAAEPFHEIITPFQRDFQKEIGKNHAKYFDENGWLYFTGERFDLLYPSYGDTYPTYMGAIGMTYEQAGNGDAGLGINTNEGFELTLKDRLAHHTTTGISTVEIASKNVEKLRTEFKKFFNNSSSDSKSYAVNGSPDKIGALKRLLDFHEITYSTSKNPKIKGYNYTANNNSGLDASENTLVINSDQPKGKMIKVLFEPAARLVDSLTYDITAWSIPYAYGLDAVASDKPISEKAISSTTVPANTATPKAAGYISKWDSMEDAKFLAALLKDNFKVRFTQTAFENAKEKFTPGSLVITKSDNKNFQDFDEKLVALANEYGRQLHSASSSFATSGPDFGSSEIKIINKPRIGVLRGNGTSSLNFGEIWYFFEQELNYHVTTIDTDYFNEKALSNLDVIVLPSGYYSRILSDDSLRELKDWVRNGGKVIAIGNAISSFAGKDGFNLKENKPDTKEDTSKNSSLIPYNQREREDIKELITGSIIKTKVDNTHPLAFGYNNSYYSLKLSNDSYSYLTEGYNVAYLEETPEVVSGFAGSKAIKNIKNSMIFGEEPMGRGSFVYLVDNPLFRAFWENGKLFFVNSIFFVNNDDYKM